jgi:hypothetical protein
MGSLRRSDTRLDNEMSERTSERCRNGLSLGHCMSERAGRRSRRSRTGEWKVTVRGALRLAAVLRADWASATAGSATHRASCTAVQARAARTAKLGRQPHWQCSKAPAPKQKRVWGCGSGGITIAGACPGSGKRGQCWRLRYSVAGLQASPRLTCSSLPQSRAAQAVRMLDVSCSVLRLQGFPGPVGTLPQCGKLLQ